ncbi:hypothetical protein K470DRAFT_263972 [Piedraia hortae CBS 480.64]|uniref:Uncharacterized protein n=1 Tax=Piedraia hortae CBS 480.64 TaxID=1314780 RepID=A0A6A7C120_9PEZI|nr:hypothetical protein K470DRAFT_263972 [Piedraia hortae CBS 480.64]
MPTDLPVSYETTNSLLLYTSDDKRLHTAQVYSSVPSHAGEYFYYSSVDEYVHEVADKSVPGKTKCPRHRLFTPKHKATRKKLQKRRKVPKEETEMDPRIREMIEERGNFGPLRGKRSQNYR